MTLERYILRGRRMIPVELRNHIGLWRWGRHRVSGHLEQRLDIWCSFLWSLNLCLRRKLLRRFFVLKVKASGRIQIRLMITVLDLHLVIFINLDVLSFNFGA